MPRHHVHSLAPALGEKVLHPLVQSLHRLRGPFQLSSPAGGTGPHRPCGRSPGPPPPREDATKKKPGEWIKLNGYDHNKLAEKRHPTKEELDEAAPSNPVQLTRCCAHMGVYNTLALKIAGVTSADQYAPRGMDIPFFEFHEAPPPLCKATHSTASAL